MSVMEKNEKRLWHILDFSLAVSFFLVTLRVLDDVRLGGHGHKQGDYLINNLVEPVRRGHFGTAIIWVSDVLLGSNP